MDRYKFEDSISAYIENELSLTDRREFEDYIEKNPDAKSLLEEIVNNMGLIKGLPKVKASSSFIIKTSVTDTTFIRSSRQLSIQ